MMPTGVGRVVIQIVINSFRIQFRRYNKERPSHFRCNISIPDNMLYFLLNKTNYSFCPTMYRTQDIKARSCGQLSRWMQKIILSLF